MTLRQSCDFPDRILNTQPFFIRGQLLQTNQRRCHTMGTKMGPSYANFFVGYIEHHFFSNQYDGPKPELYVCGYIYDCTGATSSTKENRNQFVTAVNSFHPVLKCTWDISGTAYFSISGYQSFHRRQLIHTVFCFIHLHIYHMSRIPFRLYSQFLSLLFTRPPSRPTN